MTKFGALNIPQQYSELMRVLNEQIDNIMISFFLACIYHKGTDVVGASSSAKNSSTACYKTDKGVISKMSKNTTD
jgi:hypothetical protein